MACAWMYLATVQVKDYKEKSKGCGLAVTLCKITVAKFE